MNAMPILMFPDNWLHKVYNSNWAEIIAEKDDEYICKMKVRHLIELTIL